MPKPKAIRAVKAKQPKAAKAKPKNLSKVAQLSSHHDLIRLTHGGHDYIECVLQPRVGPLARVPYGFPVRSRTLRVKCTGTFTASPTTAGATAFLVLSPWRMISNSDACVWFTTNAYTGTDTTVMDASSVGVTVASSNSDYSGTTGSLDNTTVAFRLVAAELDVSVTSSSLSRQGSLVVFTEPSHENLLAQNSSAIPGQTPATVMNYEGCRVRAVPMGNAVERCIWGTPEKPGETEWFSYGQWADELGYLTSAGLTVPQANAYLAGDAGYGAWYGANMCAIASGGTTGGASGTATVYRFEAYAVFEVVGATITGRGPGCSDPVAFQAASNYVQRTPGATQVSGSAKDALAYLAKQAGYVDQKGNIQYGALAKDAYSAVSAAASFL